MPDPTISVVIPTRGRLDACRWAVESALGQTLAPLEVLVCEDGATRAVRSLVDELRKGDDRVRYIGGLSAGTPAVPRNRGVESAAGTWVGFLDDDDLWMPQKLERQAPYLDGSYAAVAANARRTSGGLYFDGLKEPCEIRGRALLRENPLITSTVIANRRRVLEAGGFPAPRRLAGVEDYCLWLALAEADQAFLILPEPLVVYEDGASDKTRLSRRSVQLELELSRHFCRQWIDRPRDWSLAYTASTHLARAVKIEMRCLTRR